MIYKTNLKRRFLAGFIDYAIIYSLTFLLIFAFGTPDVEGTYHLNGLPALIPVTGWLILTVVFESLLGGTLGNSIMGLKVLPANMKIRNLTFKESLKRHLLDPIDMFMFGLIAIITINNTDKRQRLGDIWANTIVVKASDITPIKNSIFK